MENPLASPLASRAPSWREVGMACVVMTLLLSAQVLISGTRSLFGRDLWLDEVCTRLVVTDDQGLGHAVSAMAHGADANLPTYHAAVYALRRAAGGYLDECTRLDKAMRVVSFLSVALALAGVYATLRCAFPRLPAVAGALTVWSNWEVIEYTFEARMYAPLLAARAWFAFALAWRSPDASRLPHAGRAVLLAVSAALLCTLHYQGIIAWALMTGGALLCDSGTLAQRLRRFCPALAGPAALACFIPFYLTQRAHTPAGPWQAPPTAREVWQFFVHLTPYYAILAAVIGLMLTRRERPERATHGDAAARRVEFRRRVQPLVPLAALILYLPAVVVFSYTVQPVLGSTRYGLLAALGWAPVVAYMAWRALPSQATMLCLILLVLAHFGLINSWHWKLRDNHILDARIKLFHKWIDADSDLVVCTGRYTLYPAVSKDRTLTDRCFNLDFDAPPGQAAPVPEIERDLGRAIQTYFTWPRMIRTERLRQKRQFYMFGPTEDIERMMKFVPGFTVTDLLSPVEAEYLKGQLALCVAIPAAPVPTPAPEAIPTRPAPAVSGAPSAVPPR